MRCVNDDSEPINVETVPLTTVTLTLHDKPAITSLPHVLDLISTFLDCSADIPLHQACALGSLPLLDRIWTQSLLPLDKCRRWCPAASLQTNRHYKRWQFSQSLLQAVRRRDLDIIKWLFSHFTHCVSDVGVVEEAASTGQLEILRFLLEKDSGVTLGEYEAGFAVGDKGLGKTNGVTWGGKALGLAVKNGHYDAVCMLLDHSDIKDYERGSVLFDGVLSGNLATVKLLVSRGFRTDDLDYLFEVVAMKGYLPMLQWLMKEGFPDENHRVPLPSKHLDVIKWLVESGMECGDGDAFANACGEGPMPVVWWLADHLRARSIVLDSETAQYALESAAEYGRLELVKWLLECDIGKDSTWAIHVAASNGHLEAAKYLHSQGLTGCMHETLANAAKSGHLDVVKWLWTEFGDDSNVDLLCLHGKRGEFVSRASPLSGDMYDAASNGHLAVIQYLHTVALALAGKKRKRGEESRHPRYIEMDSVVTEAARNGHLDVVEWVCLNTTVESTEDAMVCAASGGHLPVMQWLHANRSEECGTVVMDEAAGCGNLSVLKWAFTNRSDDEECSTYALDCAARSGHLHVLRWLVNNPPEWYEGDVHAMTLALKGNHFDALLFVHAECKEWGGEMIRLDDDASYNEHMEAWLEEELGDSSESD
ncbi:hypothetical protein PR001_g20542 [Phytophthora rubi]|uniref:Uncharacterized protein n=1 Tax=Phytophthora rubi TaxID=129364 RepID=A0A6A3J8K0_9STRA|nr:hypothetical protein PR002_g21091 [Phytophthora rubi]KAE8993904.1 hypothetical protein PR001_g20542 [Phytophthora rubi]